MCEVTQKDKIKTGYIRGAVGLAGFRESDGKTIE